jgi:peptide deformylase
MNILKFPDPFLFEKTKEVTVFGPELKTLLDAMYKTMIDNKGIGLAANQVGLSFRMFVMTMKDSSVFFVNPKITDRSIGPANIEEGCLSAPGEALKLDERASWVKVSYQDETGKKHEKVFKGIHSVCVQHEIDHLDGKSYLQSRSINRARRKELAKKWGIKLK